MSTRIDSWITPTDHAPQPISKTAMSALITQMLECYKELTPDFREQFRNGIDLIDAPKRIREPMRDYIPTETGSITLSREPNRNYLLLQVYDVVGQTGIVAVELVNIPKLIASLRSMR